MAGVDTRTQEAEFVEFARRNQNDSEFDALIGLASTVEKKAADAKPKEAETKKAGD
jgi:hypothetical protein